MHDETIKPSRLRHKDIINQMDKWFKNGLPLFRSGQSVSMETLAFASWLMTIPYNEVSPFLPLSPPPPKKQYNPNKTVGRGGGTEKPHQEGRRGENKQF